jgi:DNA-binding GntR family transcriptional regulator
VAHSFLYDWMPRLYPTEPFLPEHHRILALLDQGRISEAEAALEAHRRVSLGRALARIEVVAGTAPPPALPYLEALPAPGR